MSGGYSEGDGYDERFKVLLVGDSSVGKSSLLLRFSDDVFEDLQPTVGVDFKVKSMKIDGKNIKITLWDTAGQERFRTMTSAYYRGAHGIILVYDVTQRETFENLQNVWVKESQQYSTYDHVVTMVVANKLDLESKRDVSRAEGEKFARISHSLYAESSAKTSMGVVHAFEELIRKIMETPELCGSTRPFRDGNTVGLYSNEDENSSCSC
mmetsp:Transcript_11264/g.20360  ORF Transcript_11264/g.20360 Transcript_11264/m.20360 type:complete len:210 (-) Transcript_11264:771-1400(-)